MILSRTRTKRWGEAPAEPFKPQNFRLAQHTWDTRKARQETPTNFVGELGQGTERLTERPLDAGGLSQRDNRYLVPWQPRSTGDGSPVFNHTLSRGWDPSLLGKHSPNGYSRCIPARGMSRIKSLVKIALQAIALSALVLWPAAGAFAEDSAFTKVTGILQERCLDCHSAPDPEGKFLMQDFASLMKGGESGPAILPGKSGESLLVKMIEGKVEKDGKRKIMPPGKREKLSESEITTIRLWIDAGAKAPSENALIAKALEIPKITPRVPPKRAVYSMAYEPKGKVLALGRNGEVEIYSAEEQSLVRKLSGPSGNVNAVAFSPDGKILFGAGGQPGLKGEINVWKLSDGSLLRVISGHADAIYALAVSPDGKLVASGSYDQKIKIWDAESGAEVRTLSGHNGCIYALSFRPDGKILASASGDRTVKLWDVESGARRDTLSQPLKEQYTVAFSPDGKHLAGAGVDNRIRVWEVSEQARETTNPLLFSTFAHESSILKIGFSSDGKTLFSSGEDRQVKLWNPETMQERRTLGPQPDWASAVAFILENKGLAVGRLDGSLAFYDGQNGSMLSPPKPEIARIEPRGIERGRWTKVKVIGKNLAKVDGVKASDSRLQVKIATDPKPNATEIWLEARADSKMPREGDEITLLTAQEKSASAKLYVDDIPQVAELESGSPQMISTLPATIWGVHRESGDKDTYEFSTRAGETLVFDAAAKSIGSKSELVLTLTDLEGKVIDTDTHFDKTGDPLIAHHFKQAGKYRLIVSELVLAGSQEHFYRVSIGAFPFITSVFPPVLEKESDTKLRLIGFNLSEGAEQSVKTQKAGEQVVKLDPERYRWRREMKVAISEQPVVIESESNNSLLTPKALPMGAIAAGRITSAGKEDWFKFEAKAGQSLILETAADRIGSPLDTKLEIRDAAGKPIMRTILQAVRGSAVTFRGIDSTTVDCRVENWEEMELNQFLYLQGEVVRLFRAPQGPDSGFNFYALNGRRRTYFDTTSSAHANAEPCYIVEAHAPGDKLVANGLPTFPIYFENDDDAEHKLGTDSKLYFQAPSDGTYLARVTDSRSFGGDRFIYTLTVREPHPDFKISVDGMNPTVPKGSGQRFTVSADRIDGFEGEIKLEVSGLPPGFIVSNPLTIQEGHTTAFGTIFATTDAPPITPESENSSRIVATAEIKGMTVTHEEGSLGKISTSDKAPLFVELDPTSKAAELTIAPGETVPAFIKIRRNGHNDLVTFQVENLPHGIIVDNIGLNGVLIPKDQNEREIFIKAAKWVPETDRLCFAISNEAGRQTSRPVLVKVRKSAGHVASK
jgi:WD40 repeat protein